MLLAAVPPAALVAAPTPSLFASVTAQAMPRFSAAPLSVGSPLVLRKLTARSAVW